MQKKIAKYASLSLSVVGMALFFMAKAAIGETEVPEELMK